jgi:ribosomal protein S18 acetylase RimI-like enzyme
VQPASPPSPQAAGFVRPARAGDAADLTQVQVASWGCSLAAVVPPGLLAELTGDEASAVFTSRWREAITSPPTSRHRVLVAVADIAAGEPSAAAGEPSAAAGEPSAAAHRPAAREVVGLVSAGPATDADRWPGTDAEIYEFRVRPDRIRQGHGSRLLQAAADTLADDGFRTASTWILEADQDVLRFLEAAGWALDGARAELEVGVAVPVVRLHTRLSE